MKDKELLRKCLLSELEIAQVNLKLSECITAGGHCDVLKRAFRKQLKKAIDTIKKELCDSCIHKMVVKEYGKDC